MNLETIRERRTEIPVTESTEVLVAGGGIAGISAALAAAPFGEALNSQFFRPMDFHSCSCR